MRRMLALLIPAFVVILVAASPASAVRPDREPLHAEDFTVTGSCDFDVFVHFIANNEYVTTYFDRNGNVVRQEITGSLSHTLTNVDTGKTIYYNISGPGTLNVFPDGSSDFILGGRSSIFFSPGDVSGLPLFFVNSGQVILHFDPDGNLTGVDQFGHIEDVCAALA